jgi:hypothetical protein
MLIVSPSFLPFMKIKLPQLHTGNNLQWYRQGRTLLCDLPKDQGRDCPGGGYLAQGKRHCFPIPFFLASPYVIVVAYSGCDHFYVDFSGTVIK